MPIYEYQCDHCDHQFELLKKFSDATPKICPHCGKGSVRKLVSAAAFHLKGSGWYVTDFRDKSKAGKETDKEVVPAAGSEDKKAAPAKTEATPSTDTGSTDKKTVETPAKATAAKSD